MSESSSNGNLFEDNRCFLNYITQHSQVLIIYDSVCDIDLLQRVLPLPTSNAHILVTTRMTDFHLVMKAAQNFIHLDPLPVDHAVSAILSWSSCLLKYQSEDEVQRARELVSCLPISSLPLSIVHAGRLAQSCGINFSQLKEILDMSVKEFRLIVSNMHMLFDSFHLTHLKEQLMRHLSSPDQLLLAQFEDINLLDISSHDKLVLYVIKHRLSDSQLSHIVFQLALNQVAESEPDAIEMLESTCLMGSENVPGSIIEQIVFGDREHKSFYFSKAVVILSSLSLATVYESSDKYYLSLHPAIQSVLIERVILSGMERVHKKLTDLSECLMSCTQLASQRTIRFMDKKQQTALAVHLYCVAGHILSNQCNTLPCRQLVTVACTTALDMGHNAISFDLCNQLLKMVELTSRGDDARNISSLWTGTKCTQDILVRICLSGRSGVFCYKITVVTIYSVLLHCSSSLAGHI